MNTLARRIAALERRRPEELPGEWLVIIRPFDDLDPEGATA